MRTLLLIILLTAVALASSTPVIAAQTIEQKVSKLEARVAKKFSKTFCNSTGFGISEEGALKFSLGETKVEFSKNPLIDEVDIEKIKGQILNEIADTCYYFQLDKNALSELTLPSSK